MEKGLKRGAWRAVLVTGRLLLNNHRLVRDRRSEGSDMPRRSSTSKPYKEGKGPGGLETHFSKCPFCARKILVQVGLFGVSHNLGVTAVCGDCIRERGVDPKYWADDPSNARQIEAWAGARPRLRGPPAEVVIRKMRDDRSRRISPGRAVL